MYGYFFFLVYIKFFYLLEIYIYVVVYINVEFDVYRCEVKKRIYFYFIYVLLVKNGYV